MRACAGSWISVSGKRSAVSGNAPLTAYGSPLTSLEGFHEFEHLLHVAGHLHAAPFPADDAHGVDGESAALDPAYLSAVHIFHLDDIEELARLFLAVREQLEGEAHLRLEVLVRLHAVARD